MNSVQIKKNSQKETLYVNLNIQSNTQDQKYDILKENSKLNNHKKQKKSRIQKNQNFQIMFAENQNIEMDGFYKIRYPNGNIFQGIYKNSIRLCGKLTFAQAECVYQGEFQGQHFFGEGKLSYVGGRIILGRWQKMNFIGNATIIYPNKDVYYGSVDKKLFKHGNGQFILHNGYKYIGHFIHGSISGFGRYYKDQKLLVEGVWQRGKLVKQFYDCSKKQKIQMKTFRQKIHRIKTSQLKDRTKLPIKSHRMYEPVINFCDTPSISEQQQSLQQIEIKKNLQNLHQVNLQTYKKS